MVSFKDVTFWLHLQILTLQCRSSHECSYSSTYIDIISLWRSLMEKYVKKKIEKTEINLDSCNLYTIVLKVLGCFTSKSMQ